jgi:hydroxypyruvate isomerase
MKFSLCLDPFFRECDDYCVRAEKAAALGFDAVEFWDARKVDLPRMRETCEKAGIRISGFNAVNSWSCPLSSPTSQVVENFKESLKMALEANANHLLFLSGNAETRVPSHQAIITKNLSVLAPLAEENGITLILEALNSLVDHRGYFLDSSDVGFEIIKCVGSPNVGLLFDIYHMQIMEGNLISNMTKNADLIKHIHVAGVPCRHEPFLGEVNYPNVLKALHETGYTGYIGLEYFPTCDSQQSLADVLKRLKEQ